MINSKQVLRVLYRSLRMNLAYDECNILNEKIFFNFLRNIILPNDSIIAGYHSINNEANINKLLEFFIHSNYTVCLPDDEMCFRIWRGEELLLSKFSKKLKVPSNLNSEVTPNIVLSPLLAADLSGNRVGYGKGLYDKTIGLLRKNHIDNLIYIGICYDFQIVENIESDSFDEKLDMIVTENQIYITNKKINLNNLLR